MLILDASETAARLPYPELASTIARVLRDAALGRAAAPERMHLPLAHGGVLLVMPAADDEIAITKLVSVHPENRALGLPTIQGEVVALDAALGVRLGILDGPTVTARRTAAVSLLAASRLAPASGPLLVVGAGAQARAHVEAFRAGLGIAEVYVSSRTRAAAEELAAHAASLGMTAHVVERPEEALARTPLIVTATTSTTPVLPDMVRPDAFIAAVGSFTPDMAEVAPELVRRCRLFVDAPASARHEAGDLLQAGVDLDTVTALARARDTPRPDSGPVLFKSVGNALFDLAAAKLAFGR